MKRLALVVNFALLCAEFMLAQGPYRTVKIRDIQFCPLDSLLKADTLQNTQPNRWTLQTSSFYRSVASQRETVEVVAQVVVPPKVITFTGAGFTMLLRDTGSVGTGDWTGLFARAASTDTVALINAGFLNIATGDIIRVRGWVDEFPTGTMNASTQFVPIPGGFQLLDSKPVPKPITKDVQAFYKGVFPTNFPGGVRYSTGEPFEGVMVELTGLTITGTVNATNGTFSMVDDQGNEISMLDVSKWFTLRVHRDPTSTYTLPPVFSKVDTIRGYLTTNSGTENNRGYRIAPVFPGDLKIGKILPLLSTHRRNPVALTSADTAKISVRAYSQTGGLKLGVVLLQKSINNSAFVADTMKPSGNNDSTYLANILPQSANTFVRYFIQAVDTAGNMSTLASSSSGASGTDTARGMFFYTVLDRPLTVQDLQYTPFNNGRSSYIGATVTVSGIVTADTADIKLASTTSQNSPWYLQTSNQAWSGLWFTGTSPSLQGLQKGDSVSVTGTVIEQFDVTQVSNATASVLASGKSLPSPALVTTGTFGSFGNGTPSAEQWEGMVVRINTPTVTNTNPTFADLAEYEITDGTTPMLVRTDGKSVYSNVIGDTSTGKTVFYTGDQLSYIQGVVWFSFNRYKLVPRGNLDFGVSTPSAPALVSPAAGATGQPLNVVLKWRRSPLTAKYRLQVAADAAFSSVVFHDSTISDTTKQMTGLSTNTKYYWRVNAKNIVGTSAYSSVFDFTTGTQTGADVADGAPKEFGLDQNYPNPFNPLTAIRFALPARSRVRLQVFNLLGQEVVRLVDEELEANVHERTWNASGVSSGLYFYRLEAITTEARSPFVQVKKMVLLK